MINDYISFFSQFLAPPSLINMFQCIYELCESPKPIQPFYPFATPSLDRGSVIPKFEKYINPHYSFNNYHP